MSLIFPAGQFQMLGTIFRGQLTGRWPGLGVGCPVRTQAGVQRSKGRLAARFRFDLRRGSRMRLAPNTDTVPASVNKYLLPHERQVVSVHQHPAVLIRPIFEVLIGLAIAGWVSSSIAHGNNTVILVIWILWALLLLRLLWKVFEWSENYFVITSQRLLLSEGFLTHKVNMMPLAKVTDIELPAVCDGPARLWRIHRRISGPESGAAHRRSPPLPRAAVSRGLRADLQGERRKHRLACRRRRRACLRIASTLRQTRSAR